MQEKEFDINKIIEDLSELVIDKMGQLPKKELKALKKKIRLYEEIEKALPDNKKDLLGQYYDLVLTDTLRDIDKALEYAIKHENELLEAALGERE